MRVNRKTIIICSLIVLLFIVGYAYNTFTNSQYTSVDYTIDDTSIIKTEDNITQNTENTGEGSIAIVEENKEEALESSSSAFFYEYRIERDKNRSQEREMWEDIINNQNTDQTFKNLAQQELVKIVSLTEKEMIIENLIISRGFNDALVFMTDDSVTVIVDTKELTQAQVAQIQDIVVSKTKVSPSNIKIMKKD